MRKRQGSLYVSLLFITLIPSVVLGILIAAFVSQNYKNNLELEVEEGLRNLTVSLMETYDVAYPGEYAVNESGDVVKGDFLFLNDFTIIDNIKRKSNVEISVIYDNIRVITTLRDINGDRINGTEVASHISKEILENGKEYFSNDLTISGKNYYGYYMPLENDDGKVIGMLFVGKSSADVKERVNQGIKQIVLIVFVILCVGGILSILFTTKIVRAIQSMMEFLRRVATGDLKASQKKELLERNDEIGEMGRLTLEVQRSLRYLIERDGLTNLYNRRSGEKKLRDITEQALTQDNTFVVAIADIDLFKKFNDEHGHECGDIVLKNVAEQFLNLFKNLKGYAVRWGGEEFLLVFNNMTLDQGRECCEQLISHIREMVLHYENKEVYVTITIGMAQYIPEESMDALVKRADDKLYVGKSNGRDQAVV